MASAVGAGGQGEAIAAFLSLIQRERISALTKEELTVWALANGWRVIAGHPSLTKPGAPNDPIVRLVLKATVATLRCAKPPVNGRKWLVRATLTSCKARKTSRRVAVDVLQSLVGPIENDLVAPAEAG